MTKKKILIIVICLLAALLAALIIMLLGSKSSQQVSGTLPTEQSFVPEDTTATENIGGEQTEMVEGTKPENSAEPTETTDAAETTEPEKESKPTEDSEPMQDTKPTQSTEPSVGETEPSTPPFVEEEPVLPEEVEPEQLPPEVTVPTEDDPDTGKQSVSFPNKVPGYDLVIEKLDSYEGLFVEDGSNAQIESVAMMLIRNAGDYPVEYTQICAEFEGESLIFDISALPAGEKMVVQEKTGKRMPDGKPVSVTAMVVRRPQMEMSSDMVQVTDNGDNTLTIRNLSGKTIPTVRVFYKYYMENEQIFVGGIAFTLRVTRLNAGESVTVQPAHYTSQTSRVVMVLTYDSEV